MLASNNFPHTQFKCLPALLRFVGGAFYFLKKKSWYFTQCFSCVCVCRSSIHCRISSCLFPIFGCFCLHINAVLTMLFHTYRVCRRRYFFTSPFVAFFLSVSLSFSCCVCASVSLFLFFYWLFLFYWLDANLCWGGSTTKNHKIKVRGILV